MSARLRLASGATELALKHLDREPSGRYDPSRGPLVYMWLICVVSCGLYVVFMWLFTWSVYGFDVHVHMAYMWFICVVSCGLYVVVHMLYMWFICGCSYGL